MIILMLQFILMSCQEPTSSKESLPPPVDTESDLSFTEDPYIRYNQFDEQIKEISSDHAMDWMLVKAVIIKESHFDDTFISTAGAVGLMQLMPREGSYISENYRHFMSSRRQFRNKSGERIYRGKKDEEWASLYVQELDSIRSTYKSDSEELYESDARFNPEWNLNSGITQLANDFNYFRKRGHGTYGSRIYALAAYNAGRGAVVVNKSERKLDRIPVNRQTELYVGYIERIYEELKKQAGTINKENEWVLKI